MAKSRPESMIIPSEVSIGTNTTQISKKRPAPIHGHSSSSSNDIPNGKTVNSDDPNSSLQNLGRTTTTSSTTTDSDFESEHDDNLNLQLQKTDSQSPEQKSRRVKHFHKLFKTEISGDMPDLIDTYVCAYQGDILLQGKMYITDRYLCFHSRIISYVTKHVYRWEQIEDITKERVAFIFPTAIGIQLKTTDKKIVYASFLFRDQAHEKIVSIWSRYTNDTSSYDDDDGDRTQNGTLKATNKLFKRHSYDNLDEVEQDEVLQMCLKESNKRPVSLVLPKHSNGKQQSKKLINTYDNKALEKNSHLNEKVSNGSNEDISNKKQRNRDSRMTKIEKKQNEIEKKNSSSAHHGAKNASLKVRQSHSQDRTLSPSNETISRSNSSQSVVPTINPPITDTQSDGILSKLLNTKIPFINLIIQSILSIFHYLRASPSRKLTVIFLVLTILFLHAFYLMKIANRIEHQLQSLHIQWTSSKRDSFSSKTKGL